MTGWHLDDDTLRRYVERADSLAEGASVEQHLLSCEQCRVRVNATASVTGLSVIDLAAVWDRTRDVVEVPRPSVFAALRAGRTRETAFAWLLPTVGFVAVVLAASTWVSPLRAAIAVSCAWLVVVRLLAARSGAPDAVLQAPAQAGFLTLAAASFSIFLLRRRRLRQLRPWR